MSIYQHFREEEQPFIDQVLSWKEQVERTYQAKLTDFLDPREQQIIDMLTGTAGDDLQVKLDGGGTYSERKRDRKSTRLNSSHVASSYAVFCLKKKSK